VTHITDTSFNDQLFWLRLIYLIDNLDTPAAGAFERNSGAGRLPFVAKLPAKSFAVFYGTPNHRSFFYVPRTGR
jgi:hypothetical protein